MARLPVLLRLLPSLVLSGTVLSSQGCEPATNTVEVHRRDETTAILGFMESARVPGLQLATVEGGAVADWTALGLVNANEDRPVSDETIFEAASLSKPVAAYVAFRMVDRGELDLDTPLWTILEYPRLAHDERARSITPRMVLSHTTGLPNWGGDPLELNAGPGEAWGYSGEGFVYLQRAMETLSGRSLQEMAAAEVFEPLGMDASSYVWRDSYDALKATGHDDLGRPGDGIRKPGDANAASSLHTTAKDYAHFLAAVLRGDGLSEASHAAMIQIASDADARGPEETYPYVAWGLGWGIQDGDRGRSIWHWGDNGVFRAFVIGYPEKQDGLVYFTNSEAGLSMAEDLLSLFFDDSFWAVRWLDYSRWNDPAHQADIELREGFLEGYEKGMEVLTRLRQDPKSEADEEIPGLLRFLAGNGEFDSARRLAAVAAEETPDDPDVRVLVAEIETEGRNYAEARDSYRRALELGADPETIQPRIAWLDEGLTGEVPPEFTPAELQAMAGQYGPRRIFVQDGRLMYSRDGSTPTALIPLTRTLFALESNATFRIRFDEDPDGVFGQVLGRYSEGGTDVSVRNHDDRN